MTFEERPAQQFDRAIGPLVVEANRRLDSVVWKLEHPGEEPPKPPTLAEAFGVMLGWIKRGVEEFLKQVSRGFERGYGR